MCGKPAPLRAISSLSNKGSAKVDVPLPQLRSSAPFPLVDFGRVVSSTSKGSTDASAEANAIPTEEALRKRRDALEKNSIEQCGTLRRFCGIKCARTIWRLSANLTTRRF
jgi:hypothetical protein